MTLLKQEVEKNETIQRAIEIFRPTKVEIKEDRGVRKRRRRSFGGGISYYGRD